MHKVALCRASACYSTRAAWECHSACQRACFTPRVSHHGMPHLFEHIKHVSHDDHAINPVRWAGVQLLSLCLTMYCRAPSWGPWVRELFIPEHSADARHQHRRSDPTLPVAHCCIALVTHIVLTRTGSHSQLTACFSTWNFQGIHQF